MKLKFIILFSKKKYLAAIMNFIELLKIFPFKVIFLLYYFVLPISSFAGTGLNDNTNYTVDQGLSSNIVNSICQDENGFIWIATNEGLNRFDGYEIDAVENPASDSIRIKSNVIRKIICYNKNFLFLATNNGLYQFDLTNYSFKKIPLSVTDKSFGNKNQNIIFDILKLQNGKLLVSTSASLLEYTPSSSSLKDLLMKKKYQFLKGKIIKNMAEAGRSQWFLTKENILYYEKNNGLKKFNFIGQIGGLMSDEHFVYVTGVGNTFFRIDGRSNQIDDFSDVLKKSPDGRFFPVQVAKYGKDKFVVASSRFVYSVNLNQKSIRKIETPELYGIRSILTDKSGVLWIGTNGLGIFKIDLTPLQFATLSKEKGSLSFLSVRAMLPIDNRYLLAGGLSGLNLVNMQTLTFQEIPEFRNTTVYSLLRDNVDKNVIWVSVFNRGIKKYNLITGKSVNVNLKLNESDLTGLRFFKSCKGAGDTFYFGTNRGLLIIKDNGKKFELKRIVGQNKSEIRIQEMKALFVDSQKRVWIGTSHSGVFLFDMKQNKIFRMNNFLGIPQSVSANHFFEDKHKNIWIAASTGLLKFNEKNHSAKIYNKSNGFSNNHIYSILEDKMKNLWLSSGKGIMKFNPVNGKVKIFTNQIDLPSKEFNTCAYYKDDNGNLYFGGITGIVKFNPLTVHASKFNPSPIFASFTKYLSNTGLQKTLSVPEKLNLNYFDKYFTFKLAATDFRNPTSVKYRYKLNENESWIYLNEDERNISFYKLNPGYYDLTISATNSDGVWSDKTAKINMYIKPPFWKTVWFEGLSLIALASLLFVFYRKRINRFEKEKSLREEFSQKLIASQEEEKEKIAGNLHDGLGQNLIVVKNKLLLTESGNNSERHLKESIEILSNAITDVSNLSHFLRPVELDQLGLTLAIESMIERFDEITDITFKVTLPDIDEYFNKDSAINIFRVFQEALNNIVKHSNADTVKINVAIEENLLKINIEDNGKGFLIENPNDNEKSKRPHFGIAGMKERLRILKGDFNIDSSKRGTVIALVIPLQKL